LKDRLVGETHLGGWRGHMSDGSAARALEHVRHPAVLSFALGGWGDRLLKLPALQALDALFPGRLVLVGEQSVYERLYNGIHWRRVCSVREADWTKGGDLADVGQLAAEIGDCDLLLSLNSGYFPRFYRDLLDALRPGTSIGFSPPFEIVLPRPWTSHQAEWPFAVPTHLNRSLNVEDFARPRLASQYEDLASSFLALVPAGCRILAVHPDTKPGKMWIPSRFTEVVRHFLACHPDFIAIVFGRAGQNVNIQGDRVISGQDFAVPLSMCLVGRSDIFLGVDSCLLHAADMYGVPGVGLFGPTEDYRWGFRFAPHRHVRGDGGLMTTITVDAVMEALEALLRTRGLATCGPLI
jgi:hypothetical protein